MSWSECCGVQWLSMQHASDMMIVIILKTCDRNLLFWLTTSCKVLIVEFLCVDVRFNFTKKSQQGN